jgi:hypothetical protein
VYTCTDQENCQWLVKTTAKHRPQEETLLRVTDARRPFQASEKAFRTWNMTDKDYKKFLIGLKVFIQDLKVRTGKFVKGKLTHKVSI